MDLQLLVRRDDVNSNFTAKLTLMLKLMIWIVRGSVLSSAYVLPYLCHMVIDCRLLTSPTIPLFHSGTSIEHRGSVFRKGVKHHQWQILSWSTFMPSAVPSAPSFCCRHVWISFFSEIQLYLWPKWDIREVRADISLQEAWLYDAPLGNDYFWRNWVYKGLSGVWSGTPRNFPRVGLWSDGWRFRVVEAGVAITIINKTILG